MLQLFFQVLSDSSCNLYNAALNYILDKYGINEHFKLPDSDSHLIQFTRKTMLLDEVCTFFFSNEYSIVYVILLFK